MIGLTDEQKRMFYSSGYSKRWTFFFSDIDVVIDNGMLHSETPAIMESICDAEDFTLGGCIASSLEYEVSEIIANQISGLEFTAELAVLDEDGGTALQLPMGIFRIDSASRVDDKDYKRVTAYDRMYDASVDVSEWYKGYFSGGAVHTVKETRESLLRHLGIPFVEQTLLNDNVPLRKTAEPAKGTLPGTDVLRALCTLNAGFGRMDRQGRFDVVYTGATPLFPEETLYPAEDLYPEDTFAYLGASSNGDDVPEYRGINYEEYIVQKISCLYIQTETELVQTGGDDSNPYIISSNFLLQGKTAAELQEIGKNIFGRIKDITYRPNTTELTGLPYMEVGDAFGLIKRTDTVESFIFSRTLSGIQALKDTYEAKGSKIRANELTVSERIDQLQGKAEAIEGSVEGVAEDVGAVAEDVKSMAEDMEEMKEQTTVRFEKLDESIEAEVSRAKGEEESLSARITVTAEEISSEVARAAAAEGSLSTRVSQTAESITQEAARAANAENSLSARIQLTAESITQTVSATYETKDSAESNYQQTANQIALKVSAGEVESIIDQKAHSIRMKADAVIIDSVYFSVSELGMINAQGGRIGNFTISGGTLAGSPTTIADTFIITKYITAEELSADSGKELSISGGIRTRISAGSSMGVAFDSNSNGRYHLRPGSDGIIDCGSSSYHWDNIYADNGTIQTSDRNSKKNIMDMDGEFAEKLIDGSRPKIYQYINGDSGRTHAGMVAQDVEEQIYSMGLSSYDFAGFVKYRKEIEGADTGEYGYGLRYEEYIAPLIKYCQILKDNARQKDERISLLENAVFALQGGTADVRQDFMQNRLLLQE